MMDDRTFKTIQETALLETMLFFRFGHKPKYKRIQRCRKKGWKNPPLTKYLGRPTIYGNIVKVGDIDMQTGFPHTNKSAEQEFRCHLALLVSEMGYKKFAEKYLAPLIKYKNFSCWCKHDEYCHVDVWIEYLDEYATL